MALGDILEIDDRTLLVLGQPLVFDKGQPDVANALLHRVDDTLFLVDTGVTEAFRKALLTAVDRLGPWQHLVLLTTHGHVDHIGNNDLIDQLAAERNVKVEHFLPALDAQQMIDPLAYWSSNFDQVGGVVPLPAPPKLVASKVVSLFTPMRPFGRTSRSYEELPLERISIGTLRLTGWTFADGAVRVVRSQGHCAGHVIVQLRDSKLLHLSDEANGPCVVMNDADQVKQTSALGAGLTMLEEQQVTVVTDGHSFVVQQAPEARERLNDLLDQAVSLHDQSSTAAGRRSTIDPGAFEQDYGKQLTRLGVGGANPNPAFTAMMALNALKELCWSPSGRATSSPWERPALVARDASVGAPRRLIKLVGTAVSFGAWRLRGRAKSPKQP